MSAFLKVLFGDAWNVAVVAAIVLAAVMMVEAGYPTIAAYVVPPLTLAGVALLIRR